MSITNHMINKDAYFVRDPIDFSLPVAPAATSSNIIFGRQSPLFPFLVIGVRLYGLSFTNVTSVDVGLAPTAGGAFTSCLNAQVVPVNDQEVAGVLTATLANLRGTATSQIIVKYTTGSGPAAVNAFINVVIRPRPLDGDPVV